jgi:predicted RNase H-like nuclease (RuvC/YqgF family)
MYAFLPGELMLCVAKQMSKTIKKLEKENFSLKKKCEKSDVTIIELLDERASLKKQAETSKNQKEKLEALCRSLQAERKSAIAGTLPSQASLQVIC